MLYGERNMKIAMVINTTDTYKTREIEELCKCNKDETINVYYILDNDEGVPLKNKETNLFVLIMLNQMNILMIYITQLLLI